MDTVSETKTHLFDIPHQISKEMGQMPTHASLPRLNTNTLPIHTPLVKDWIFCWWWSFLAFRYYLQYPFVYATHSFPVNLCCLISFQYDSIIITFIEKVITWLMMCTLGGYDANAELGDPSSHPLYTDLIASVSSLIDVALPFLCIIYSTKEQPEITTPTTPCRKVAIS